MSLLFHFIHDTFFLGWGIVWLWPFKKTRFKCFPDRDGKIVNKLLVTWEEDEEAFIKRYHNTHWIRDFYLRPTVVSWIEYTFFILALSVLIV